MPSSLVSCLCTGSVAGTPPLAELYIPILLWWTLWDERERETENYSGFSQASCAIFLFSRVPMSVQDPAVQRAQVCCTCCACWTHSHGVKWKGLWIPTVDPLFFMCFVLVSVIYSWEFKGQSWYVTFKQLKVGDPTAGNGCLGR
jgi:hypothetical protein